MSAYVTYVVWMAIITLLVMSLFDLFSQLKKRK